MSLIKQLGKGVATFRLMIYPKGKILSKEQKQKLIDDKMFITIHLTGNTSKLKSILGDLVIQKPKETIDRTKGYYWFNMPQFKEIELGRKLGIDITENTRWLHYPNPIILKHHSYKYKITRTINPKYPIYIISKGRWKTRYTSKALEACNCPYKIVVEPDEYDKYAEVINPKKIIKAPENFSKRGQGGIPVRNFVWEHAVKSGAKKHWILDDNLNGFYRWNLNNKWKINSAVGFKLIEDYVSRFSNIKQAGMNYAMFAPSRDNPYPITFNTRIYSCILIDHSLDEKLKERWRGKYNEDVDLSIRILKKGYATALFNAFLCNKPATLTTPGGNTDTIYDKGARDKLLAKARSLARQHPDVASVVKKYKRGIHHSVNYSKFKKNDLGYKNPNIPKGTNEYNMKLVKK
jgi:hypothetical protein